MVLESTIVCVDNSEFMRNSDFVPTRFQAQQDAVGLVCTAKTRSNPENNVGLLSLSSQPQVLATLTSDTGKILAKLHQVQPKGDLDFMTGIRIAHLTLKHRQGKNHKMRIVVFVGSPVDVDEKELVKLAKKLKKEKVNVDIINFGENQLNTDKLQAFIEAINGKEGTGSHLVTVPSGPHLTDALISSPVIQGEDGTGAAMGGAGGFDPFADDDPELALALRVSMEEQRQRQEESARRATTEPTPETETAGVASGTEEAMLQQALAMSTQGSSSAPVDFANMTEDEQVAYALQMSLQQQGTDQQEEGAESPVPMDTDEHKEERKK